MHGAAVPALLLALSLAGAVGALRCLAEHLLGSALAYALAAAALAAVAAKVVADSI
jgi:hypothetical protein